ncbi:CPBP family glutamic-type intramembrane protease [Streptomyces sp. NPDC054796]
MAEELILTAAPLALLRAARCPVWQCVTVVALLRLAPHTYMGVAALPELWAAGACAALYLASRRVLPLICAHAVYDLLAPWLPSPRAMTLSYLAIVFLVGFVAVTTLVMTAEWSRRPDVRERGVV